MELIIILGIGILIGIIAIIVQNIDKKNMRTTKELSSLYKTILSTNKKYSFYVDIYSELSFKPSLKSKRSLDNLDLAQHVMNEISENKGYYETLFAKADKNRDEYTKYSNEYKKIENYMAAEEFLRLTNANIKYKTFNKYEKKIYQTSMLDKPVVSISANCHATYTSPSGRNHYWRAREFNFTDLKLFLKQIKEQEEYALVELQRKEQAAVEKRAKEKRLRELDKLEKQLTQKEQEINQKENEFQKATQGHIYSSQTQIPTENSIVIEQEDTSYQKLKKLKTQYENNEISRTEYEEKRKALL